jgi:nitric oxide reductase subunit B
MVLLSMLAHRPDAGVGLGMSTEPGTRARRSSCKPRLCKQLRWMRVPGDILFALGAALMGWFVLGLLTGHSYSNEAPGTQTPARLTNAKESKVVLNSH